MDLRAAGVTGMRRGGLDGGQIGGGFEGLAAVIVDELELVDVIWTDWTNKVSLANCRATS